MSDNDIELAVVMPVYNEEGAIGAVLDRWAKALDGLKINYAIRVYNDGSKDGTLAILRKQAAGNPRLHIVDKPNSGHGPTILKAYRESSHAPWIFQVDSDDEMSPDSFAAFWQQRHQFDLLIARRAYAHRDLSRALVSLGSRLCVWLLYGRGVFDVNAPYRLMRSDVFRPWFEKIPGNMFAPNVILSALACQNRVRIREIPVDFRPRTTGIVSIARWKLFKAALRSFAQTVSFRFRRAIF